MNIASIIFLLCGIIEYSKGWSYDTEDTWPERYCKKGITQSPIDIVEGVNTVSSDGPKLIFENLDQSYDATIMNDGHMVKVTFDTGNITVSGGRLPGIYQLIRTSFHWNSGHTLNGERKALEVTFVWCNTLIKNRDDCEKYHNGLTFISTLYEIQDKDNELLNPVIKSLDKIEKADSSSKIKLNPRSLLPNDLKIFYRYWGSSTKPECIEGKSWSIFEELCKVSQNQVSQFLNLKGENGEVLEKTYRSTQPLNRRIISKMITT